MAFALTSAGSKMQLSWVFVCLDFPKFPPHCISASSSYVCALRANEVSTKPCGADLNWVSSKLRAQNRNVQWDWN